MPLATDQTGVLKPITQCSIEVPGAGKLNPYVLPEISESKSATYADEPVIGRAFPIKTYGHSDNRTINMKWHVLMINDETKTTAVKHLNAFRSCVYPTSGGQGTYGPPPICRINCGQISKGGGDGNEVCAVLKSYSVSYPTDVAWDEENFLPYRFDIDLVWDVVFATDKLPGQDKILN